MARGGLQSTAVRCDLYEIVKLELASINSNTKQ